MSVLWLIVNKQHFEVVSISLLFCKRAFVKLANYASINLLCNHSTSQELSTLSQIFLRHYNYYVMVDLCCRDINRIFLWFDIINFDESVALLLHSQKFN